MTQEVRVGLIGYKFMGQVHSNAYSKMPMFFDTESTPVLKAICGRTEAAVARAARKSGSESYETSWEKLVRRNDIDLVDITTPNSTHREIVLAAAAEGKHILCEKPLAMDLKETEEMLKAVKDADVKHMICFNFRKVPAIALAKKFIDEGSLGRIYHFLGKFFLGWGADPNFPLVWRFRKEVAGSGIHADINSHMIDLARYLIGEFDEVVGTQETFIKRRPKLRATEKVDWELAAEATEETAEVTNDDTTFFLAKFTSGALGSFEATRVALGRKAHRLSIEINGSKGSLLFNLEDINTLWLYASDHPERTRGLRKILVTEPNHPYMRAWQPLTGTIGYEHTFVHVVYDFMKAIDQGENPSPSFADGVECQRVLEAVEKSIQKRCWTHVK